MLNTSTVAPICGVPAESRTDPKILPLMGRDKSDACAATVIKPAAAMRVPKCLFAKPDCNLPFRDPGLFKPQDTYDVTVNCVDGTNV